MKCTSCGLKVIKFKIFNVPDQEQWSTTLNSAGEFDLIATGFLSSGMCRNKHMNTAITPEEVSA